VSGPRLELAGTDAGEVLVEVQPDGSVVCGWFALCDKPAAGVVYHGPTGDYFPACSSCADKLGLEVVPATFVFEVRTV
jgi:hypothetical protein